MTSRLQQGQLKSEQKRAKRRFWVLLGFPDARLEKIAEFLVKGTTNFRHKIPLLSEFNP
jgi:hypothetical protein